MEIDKLKKQVADLETKMQDKKILTDNQQMSKLGKE